MQSIMALRESFSSDGILICFTGPFTHSLIEEIGIAMKRYLEDEQGESGPIQDVFALYIEQTQNVRNYIERSGIEGNGRNSAIVVIRHTSSAYVVSSGNIIRNRDIEELEAHLSEINAQDKDGLKRMYKERLRRERQPGAVGAGIGLIDMARRSQGKLEYSFNRQDAEFSFFTLEVAIARSVES
jgi:hypothetical protein